MERVLCEEAELPVGGLVLQDLVGGSDEAVRDLHSKVEGVRRGLPGVGERALPEPLDLSVRVCPGDRCVAARAAVEVLVILTQHPRLPHAPDAAGLHLGPGRDAAVVVEPGESASNGPALPFADEGEVGAQRDRRGGPPHRRAGIPDARERVRIPRQPRQSILLPPSARHPVEDTAATGKRSFAFAAPVVAGHQTPGKGELRLGLAGDDVDDSAERIRTVQRGERALHHLHPLHPRQREAAQITVLDQRPADRLPVEEDEYARAPDPADHDVGADRRPRFALEPREVGQEALGRLGARDSDLPLLDLDDRDRDLRPPPERGTGAEDDRLQEERIGRELQPPP